MGQSRYAALMGQGTAAAGVGKLILALQSFDEAAQLPQIAPSEQGKAVAAWIQTAERAVRLAESASEQAELQRTISEMVDRICRIGTRDQCAKALAVRDNLSYSAERRRQRR